MGVLTQGLALASWQENGNPICTTPPAQIAPVIASDGAGGALIAWEDQSSSGKNSYVYAQRVDAFGDILWTADGLRICAAAYEQKAPAIISDGAGGAIVCWEDYRRIPSDIYAQRVDPFGNLSWSPIGIAICEAGGYQYGPEVASDGAGGAIITWRDRRSGTDFDIYAQRVDASGNVLWAADGVAICTAAGNQYSPQIDSDGAGGAIVTWEDKRSGSHYDIYVRRVDASGNLLWAADGVAICTAEGGQFAPQIVPHGGGAVITWFDRRKGSEDDIYAQRVDASGNLLWVADGAAICTAAGNQRDPQLASDGLGTCIITWRDRRTGGSYDIYAQRVDALGFVRWAADVGICTTSADQREPYIVPDEAGGAIVTWSAYSNGSDGDIYAQRVSVSGDILWRADGVVICAAAADQRAPQIVSDDEGGAIIAWSDSRSGSDYDIYAQRVRADGTDLAFASVSAIGTHGYVKLSWEMGLEARASSFRIERSESPDGEFCVLELPVASGSGHSFSCTDYSVLPGKTYWYRILLVSSSSEEAYGPIEVYVERVPNAYTLHQNYPNPFNPLCTIRYETPQAGRVSLRVFDATGCLVRTLVDVHREPGSYSELWDGRAEDGRELPSGVYFYRLEAGDFVAMRKMVLLR
ncbi:MAG: hypothetical protein AMJ46_14410 [Latescibacteria bacterium DG_63]|nr:MAG: hypothetical protein AMJ46_14410 [Latescibacteria bacterium DG_63]